jgi:hypothetical protein
VVAWFVTQQSNFNCGSQRDCDHVCILKIAWQLNCLKINWQIPDLEIKVEYQMKCPSLEKFSLGFDVGTNFTLAIKIFKSGIV